MFVDAGYLAGQSVDFTGQIDDRLPDGLVSIANSATIATSTEDLEAGNNSSSTDTAVTAQPDLVIAKDDGRAQVLAGDAVQYTITYRNAGNQAAAGVTVVDQLLNGVDYVSSSPPGAYDSGARTIAWSIGSLADFDFNRIAAIDIIY